MRWRGSAVVCGILRWSAVFRHTPLVSVTCYYPTLTAAGLVFGTVWCAKTCFSAALCQWSAAIACSVSVTSFGSVCVSRNRERNLVNIRACKVWLMKTMYGCGDESASGQQYYWMGSCIAELSAKRCSILAYEPLVSALRKTGWYSGVSIGRLWTTKSGLSDVYLSLCRIISRLVKTCRYRWCCWVPNCASEILQ